MEFMGISIGILALICALVLLFGAQGARKILGWVFAILAALAAGAAMAVIVFNLGWAHSFSQNAINTLGTTNAWVAAGGLLLLLLLFALGEARVRNNPVGLAIILALATFGITGAALEISNMPSRTANDSNQFPLAKPAAAPSGPRLVPVDGNPFGAAPPPDLKSLSDDELIRLACNGARGRIVGGKIECR
jgi:hypothetical protein